MSDFHDPFQQHQPPSPVETDTPDGDPALAPGDPALERAQAILDQYAQPEPLDSPLGMAAEVEALLKIDQSLCKQRGTCCRVATFKGSLSVADLEALANDPEAEANAREMARDFHSIFIPYDNQTAAATLTPDFVFTVREHAKKQGRNPDEVTFFHCKYVQADGRCGVHEDRPTGCRHYPLPHRSTFYHRGCGFEERGKRNWARIAEIMTQLGMDPNEI